MSGLSEWLTEIADLIDIQRELGMPLALDHLFPIEQRLREAASLIDQQEKALEAADEQLSFAWMGDSQRYIFQKIDEARKILQSARATSTKEDG